MCMTEVLRHVTDEAEGRMFVRILLIYEYFTAVAI